MASVCLSCSIFLEWRVAHTAIHGHYDRETHGQIDGSLFDHVPKKYHQLVVSLDKDIIKSLKAEYKAALDATVRSVYDDTKGHHPTSVVRGYSEHDMNFTLGFKEGTFRSYTINTIVAAEPMRVVHNRTLKRLHNGLV